LEKAGEAVPPVGALKIAAFPRVVDIAAIGVVGWLCAGRPGLARVSIQDDFEWEGQGRRGEIVVLGG